ncbi:hypothetical protein FGO68_gene5068 [Halteria grandinella]|uniref:Uncharacterized protein n=1 Tax=Halteria grandinella TaxID=5974 RepID=A0A8J8T483_HALGN|nr:hypothetical protein FGO68_gene5068 [Halteria grandinella]
MLLLFEIQDPQVQQFCTVDLELFIFVINYNLVISSIYYLGPPFQIDSFLLSSTLEPSIALNSEHKLSVSEFFTAL